MPSNRESSSARSYRPDIDGMRALAVMSVIFYHAGVSCFHGGYTGVDIFFVISGYLIGGHIYAEKCSGTFSYWNFYYRRVKRILPALLAVLAFTSIIAIYAFPPMQLVAFGTTELFVALSASNLYFSKSVGYFQTQSELNPLLMTWSLGVEEQFYLFIPVILSIIVRLRRSLHLPILVALSLLSFGFCILPWLTRFSFYMLPTRFWELCAGVILAILEYRGQFTGFGKRIANATGAAGILLVCLPIVLLQPHAVKMVQLLPTVIGTVLLISCPSNWISRTVFTNRPIVFIGKISYSWYLWHWPLLAFLRIFCGETPHPMQVAFTVALSFCFAVASYFVIEQPFRNVSTPPMRTVLRYGVLCPIMASIGLGIYIMKGIPQRFPQLRYISTEKRQFETDPCLSYASRPDLSSRCFAHAGTRPAVAIWGDSHAAALSSALREYVIDRGYDFAQLTKSDCSPDTPNSQEWAAARGQESCFLFNQASLDKIATDERIQIVIVAFNWKRIFQESPANRCANSDCFAYLKTSIRKLQQRGKKVIVMGDVPEFDVDPIPSAYFSQLWVWRLVTRSTNSPYSNEFGILSYESQALDDRTERALQVASEDLPGVQYVALHEQFCSAKGCMYARANKILYLDAQHLSTEGAAFALTKLGLPKAN